MKRIFLLILSVSMVLFSGCSVTNTAQTSEPGYRAYELYYLNASDDLFPSRKLTKLPLQPWYEDEDLEPISIEINGETVTGTYWNTVRETSSIQMEPVRYYNTKYGQVGFLKENKSLVFAWFGASDEMIELEKRKSETLKLTRCKQIASDFIKSVYPNVRLDDYVFTQSDLTEEYSHRYYTFTYKRSFHGLETCDKIRIMVTEHGNILRYERGMAIDKRQLDALHIDDVRIDELIENYASEICQEKNRMSYEVCDAEICRLDNGSYAWYARLVFQYLNETAQGEGGKIYGDTDFIQIVIPLETA